MKKVSLIFSVMRFFGVSWEDLVAYRNNQSIPQVSPEPSPLKKLPLEILYENDYRSFFFEADKTPVAIICGNVGFAMEDAPEDMNWNEADKYCKTYSFAGKNWQLPNKEAGHIDILYKNKEAINEVLTAFGKEPLKESWYWASETSSYYAWILYLSDGDVDGNSKGNTHYVRSVLLF